MSVGIADHLEAAETNEYEQYKALPSSAVAALALGMFSSLACLHFYLAVVPIAGVVVGLVALKKIRANSDELSGTSIAAVGLFLSLAFGIAGPSYLTYVYLTEVPDWATRISYSELQPDDDQPGQLIPPSAVALNGKKVFIKGFIYPGNEKEGIQRFILCRDQGDCCFGGKPKITDRIDVNIVAPDRVSYSQRMFKVAGTFRVQPPQTAEGIGATFYHLDAEYVK